MLYLLLDFPEYLSVFYNIGKPEIVPARLPNSTHITRPSQFQILVRYGKTIRMRAEIG